MLLITWIWDFLWDSLVLLLSGCLSLLLIGGVIPAVIFFALNWFNARPAKNSSDEVDEKTDEKSQLSYDSIIHNSARLKEEILASKVAPATSVDISPSLPPNGYHRDGEVRQFMERLIETLISGTLDETSTNSASVNNQYEPIYTKYHSRLSEVLSKMSASLHSTIDNKLLDDSEKPATIYMQLKLIVKDISQQAAHFSPSQADRLNDETSDTISSSIVDGQSKDNYEDILATIIINKILLRNNNEKIRNSAAGITNNGTGVASNEEEETSDQTDSFISPIETQMSLTVEEHIEEITTTKYHSSEEEAEESGRVSGLAKFLSGLNFLKGRRAKFPELGKDIIDVKRLRINEQNTEDNSGVTEETNDSWYKLTSSSVTKLADQSTDLDSSGITSISRDLSEGYSASSNIASSPSEDGSSLSWTAVNDSKDDKIALQQVDSGEGSLEGQQDNEYVIHVESSHNQPPSDNDVRLEKSPHSSLEPLVSCNNDQVLSSPAESSTAAFTPGSIAEREHLKWQQAAPLPNNPYSKENIEKRMLDRLLTRSYSANDRLSMNLIETRSASVTKIDCGASLPDYRKYGRDYYINGQSSSIDLRLDKRDQDDENESEINGQSASSSYSDKSISSTSFNMENKHSGKLVSVSPWLDRKNRQQYNHNMPSVKELAKQFDTPNRKKEEEIVPQRLPRQIHSLTARSMSREFREGLKQNVGRNFNRNVLPSSESSDKSIDEEHDHCSEDSGNGSPTDYSTSSAVSKLNEHVKFWKNIENSANNLSPSSNSLELQEHN